MAKKYNPPALSRLPCLKTSLSSPVMLNSFQYLCGDLGVATTVWALKQVQGDKR